jgi:hypothetical protein
MATGLASVQVWWHSRFIRSSDGPARPGDDASRTEPTSDFDVVEQVTEPPATYCVRELQAATRTARTAVVVAFAELVGVLEAVGAAAAVDRDREGSCP